ncbi:MAG: serine/threonine-protein kinase [Bifidobacterium sp.]|nr:serine/threonine-protein kinase [Bifidobacterium sp.]
MAMTDGADDRPRTRAIPGAQPSTGTPYNVHSRSQANGGAVGADAAAQTTTALGTATAQGADGAPELEGYTYLRDLGSGTTATVHLYLQHGTDRQVAIKVSKARLDPKAGARFRTEANFMARLSAHPYILSIHETGVTADGRSYIVFEYAPQGNMKDLLRQRTYDADEVLDMGIALASALATAHRAGIVHRDIKTSNVLITSQGLPALADFGIATDMYDHRSTGFSLPWAPPEVLRSQGSGDDRSDIYSLAATLYAMLAGKSPYEHGYHPHNQQELATLIITKPLPPLGRADVPAQVERVLAKALSKDPDDRYFSALEFAYAMQEAPQETYGHATPVTVDGAERFSRTLSKRRAAASPLRGAGAHTATVAVDRRPWIVAGVVLAALAVLTLLFVTLVLPRLDSAGARTAAVVNPTAVAEEGGDGTGGFVANTTAPPAPTGLTGSIDGDQATSTWTNPDPKDGDTYSWKAVDSGGAPTVTDKPTATMDLEDGQDACIEVRLQRANHSVSDAVRKCVAR